MICPWMSFSERQGSCLDRLLWISFSGGAYVFGKWPNPLFSIVRVRIVIGRHTIRVCMFLLEQNLIVRSLLFGRLLAGNLEASTDL